MKPGIGLIGKKLGMTQLFREDGRPAAVTVLEAGPCPVVLERTQGKDGYRAVQLGFEDRDPRRLSKALAGHFEKAKVAPKRILREFRLAKEEQAAAGLVVTVEIFKPGDRVDVTGRSIGKGFQGGMKRWHWKGGKQTHGSMSHRRPGSIGSSTDPSRVFKGHHLPGHMGAETVTTQAMEVVRVDAQKNLLILKGSVPGSDQGVVLIRRSWKGPKVHHAPQVKKKVAVPQAARAAGAAKPAAGKAQPAAAKPPPAAQPMKKKA